ncbi:hypothetical protein [Maridesulfovibrio sp.]|uniref:hypothetical protein n=1 Tax=Maridesulfovibrio sp. TaxID=2795000 RepID=UPI002A18C458|nr:hypothetical protein [Maridesulfovibrio sp.]
MTQLKKNRAFISAATAFTFIPTMITSILLLCHVKFYGIMSIHKWVGLAFILLCFCHIPINWAALRNHLKSKTAIPALIITVILTFSLLLFGGSGTGSGKGRHGRNIAGHSYMSTPY